MSENCWQQYYRGDYHGTGVKVTLRGSWSVIEQWCLDYVTGPWVRVGGMMFWFQRSQDAMMASLVWG